MQWVARQHNKKSLEKKNVCLNFPCKECVIEIYYNMAWKYIRSLGFGCVCSAVHKQRLHGRNSIIGKPGTIGAPVASFSGAFV